MSREVEVRTSQASKLKFRPDIQGLRGIAVLIVVIYHAGLPLSGGFVGVDVFFVISGYVITGLLVRELSDSGQIKFRSFYERRIRRLVPALVVVVVVTLAASFLLGSPFNNQQEITAKTAIGAVTLSANAVIFLNSGGYFATPPTNNPLLNTWSLSVEEQFYLVFPFVVFLLWLFARRSAGVISSRNALIGGLFLVAMLSFLLNFAMSFGLINFGLTDPEWFAFYSSPTRAWEFAIGALAFLIVRGPLSRPLSTFLFLVGVLGILYSALFISQNMIFPGWIVTIPVVSTACVLIGAMNKPFGVNVLTNRPIVAMGDVSYSWYLWHWPLIAFASLMFPDQSLVIWLAALASLPIAMLTTRYIENPIRFSNTFPASKSWLILFGSILVVTSMSILLLVGSRADWWNRGIQSMKSQVSGQHLWITQDCNSAIPVQLRDPSCTWNQDGAGPPVYLLGDSLAGSLSEAVLDAAEELNRPVVAGTQGACPFVNNGVSIDGRWRDDCVDFVEASTQWIAQQSGVDIVMSSSMGYLALDGVELSFPPTAALQKDFEGKKKAYLQGMKATVETLSANGNRVIVVLPPPGFPATVFPATSWYPSECSTYQGLTAIAECGAERSEADVLTETLELFDEVRGIVESSGGSVVDLNDSICQSGVCSTNEGNFWRYLDGTHISVGFSQKLKPVMLEYLR